MHKAIAIAVAATLSAAPPARALERVSARTIDREDWSASGTTSIHYFNNCTGWVWVWSGWSAGERLGVNFENYLPCGEVNVTWALTFSGIPSGYGFTGTIEVTDGGCGRVRASQPYLPPVTSAWSPTIWGGVFTTGRFSVNIIWGAPSGFTNSTGMASDHPLPGPTGPGACGTCFPTNRVSNSRYYGAGGAYCPSGTTLSDGLCDVEWMMDVNVKCFIGVEDETWGKIKSLYR